MSREALQRAVDAVGGQKPLADKIGTSQSNVWYWLGRAKNGVPAEWAMKIAAASGVPAHELRPDVFPCPVTVDGFPSDARNSALLEHGAAA